MDIKLFIISEINAGVAHTSGVKLTNLIAGTGTCSDGETIGVDTIVRVVKVRGTNQVFGKKSPSYSIRKRFY